MLNGATRNKYPDNPTLDEALNAKGGGEGQLLRHSTSALANAESDDLDFTYGSFISDADDLLVLDAVDLNDDTFITGDELINAVRDIYQTGTSGTATTDNFDFDGVGGVFDVGDLADALDEMNNLPHLDAGDFLLG
jgi:hypothetical protein